MSSTEPNPLRWAIAQAEYLARVSGSTVSADFEGLLAKAHKACDRAELIEAEHQKLKEALRKARTYIEQLASTVNTLSPGKVRAEDFTEVISAALNNAIP